MSRSLFRLTGLLVPLALSGCATHEVDYRGEGDGFVGAGAAVHAVVETPSVGEPGQDAADDPVIWAGTGPVTVMGTTTPGLVVGTDKKAGLYAYGLDGAILQFLPEGLLNNVDAVEGLSVDGRPQLLLGASDRTPGRTGVSLYLFDPAGTGQNGIRPWGAIATDVVEPYGFCFARLGTEVHAILVGHEGEVRQFVVTADARGRPVSREVRRFEIGSISEGCAADPATDTLYLAEENVGVWRYGLGAASGDARTLVQPIAPGILVADAEGLTTITDGEARYLIGSSQGDSTFPVWRIDGAAPAWVGRFVVRDGTIDGVTGTDGLAAWSGAIGPFPHGLVVVQDDVNDVGNQNFKYIDWRDIKTALAID
ncbi:phytase [Brevundimonas sp. AJA228-03]|uniref:phytase n=1 Tax=Brevundimonas sp. AJA228-03 TaxID=2752515 RepID=UPI001ADEC1D4|nr:phytase [Brevundimonas sp. AJA228-03]QTN20050.1 phytase [Brevundimonas sp. AJA228-03]